MINLGKRIALRLPEGAMVFLSGDLGAGKTTLVRGILYGLGHEGGVVSPTYTLLETYRVATRTLHHLDLYRMNSPMELEQIGFRDLLDDHSMVLVEWPERGQGVLPHPDVQIAIDFMATRRHVTLPSGLLVESEHSCE